MAIIQTLDRDSGFIHLSQEGFPAKARERIIFRSFYQDIINVSVLVHIQLIHAKTGDQCSLKFSDLCSVTSDT